MKHLLTCIASLFLLSPLTAQEEPADYVNPFIGTTNFGTCNPGAICPNGMMSVVPFNVMGSSDNTYDKDARWWSTPYEYTNSFFKPERRGMSRIGFAPADAYHRQAGRRLS